ncbi:CmcJ/NvfI family oxidoreductase [Erythrobacter sp. SG61-1L]|uniref:CmcJ/NvfI family oxidoreductase n=1 Tax=Erythrobacter sp. SG61-1L TaxID=1603897 RepID=UPI0006C8F6A0|nr:CmcJ/NvfI family oxidoreductase [Erythrobacter sp. SG61-1L]
MAGGSVRAAIGYTEDTGKQPYFYANAHEKDYVPLAPVEMEIADARGMETSLDREGFILVEHASSVPDLTDLDAVVRIHAGEVEQLLKDVSGADHIVMMPRGILRFSERLGQNAAHDNSHPARFAHVDMSISAAEEARDKGAPGPEITGGRKIVRSAQYNVWRVLSGPPQDVPLALCAWPSVEDGDLIDCLAIFDPPDGGPEWSFGNYVIKHNPNHRWYYYSNMRPDEAIVFKTSESDTGKARLMPHGAFDNPEVGADAPARVSLEMRGTAYWFE